VVVDKLHVLAEGLVGVAGADCALRVTIANLADCAIGFNPGQDVGTETWPDEDLLPPGWKNDTTRHEAQRGELLVPGSYCGWIMTYRKAEYEPGEGHGELSLRSNGTLASGESWSAPIAVEVTEAARKRLSLLPYERFHSRADARSRERHQPPRRAGRQASGRESAVDVSRAGRSSLASRRNAAVRETLEETGLGIRATGIVGNRVHPMTGVLMVYAPAEPAAEPDVVADGSAELAEVRWVSLAAAEALMEQMSRDVASIWRWCLKAGASVWKPGSRGLGEDQWPP
jgi:hypothetical protein